MICPKCKHEIPDDSIFCLKCGEYLQSYDENKKSKDINIKNVTNRKCYKCGEILEEDDLYCPICGSMQKNKIDNFIDNIIPVIKESKIAEIINYIILFLMTVSMGANAFKSFIFISIFRIFTHVYKNGSTFRHISYIISFLFLLLLPIALIS